MSNVDPYPLSGIIVNPNGQTSVVVNITDSHSNAASAFSDSGGQSAVTFPQTISARTTYYLGTDGPWTVSAKVNGVELAGQSVTLEGSQVGTVTLSAPVTTGQQASAPSAPPAVVYGIVSPITQSAAAASSGSNQARLYLITTLTGSATVTTVRFGVSVSSGNVDVGIYSLSGTTLTKLASSGSTACPAGGDASITIASTTLNPTSGPFYLAIAVDNTSATLYSGQGTANMIASPITGQTMYRFTSSFPLPATLATGSAVTPDVMWCTAAK